MFDDVDNFFNNAPRRVMNTSIAPAINISEDGNNVIAETPLPGIDPGKIEITIENDVLTIQGKEEKQHEVEDTEYTRHEWTMQSFHRSVALPGSVKSDDADAEYENGVLKIIIPKREEAKAKKVSVKVKS